MIKVAVATYILMLVFTFGHAVNNIGNDKNDACLMAIPDCIFWPFYWSYQLQIHR